MWWIKQLSDCKRTLNSCFMYKGNGCFSDEELETFPLNIWYVLLAAVISISLLFLLNFVLSQEMISCHCSKTDEWRVEKESNVHCYLCDKKVSKEQWTDGSHRKSCASKRRGMLERLPRPLEVNCPNCIQVIYSLTLNWLHGIWNDQCPWNGTSGMR